MNAVLAFAYRTASGIWLGAIVAISFLVAPNVFGALPRRVAGEVMGPVFSAYYALGVTLGVVALVGLGGLILRGNGGLGRWLAVVLLTGMVAAAGFSRGVVVPELLDVRAQLWTQVDRTGAEPPALRQRLDVLHHRSVTLNGGMLLAGLLLMGLEAVRDGRGAKRRRGAH